VKAQFVDMYEFDIESISEMNSTQSITLGSKMNHDRLRDIGGGFDTEADSHDEPPFA